MTELDLQQSKKADYLLEIICNSNQAIGSEIAEGIIASKTERNYIFSILKKFSLITIITETEGDPFYLFTWTENTCDFLHSKGGFVKKYHDSCEENLSSISNKKTLNLNQETIASLEDLRNGDTISLNKSTPNQVTEVIIKLYNLGFLNKIARFRYAVNSSSRKYLKQLILLKSWSDFLEWLDTQNQDDRVVNDYSGATIGQLNQGNSVKVQKTTIDQSKQQNEKRKNKFFSFLINFWWQILIPLTIGILLIIFENNIFQ